MTWRLSKKSMHFASCNTFGTLEEESNIFLLGIMERYIQFSLNCLNEKFLVLRFQNSRDKVLMPLDAIISFSKTQNGYKPFSLSWRVDLEWIPLIILARARTNILRSGQVLAKLIACSKVFSRKHSFQPHPERPIIQRSETYLPDEEWKQFTYLGLVVNLKSPTPLRCPYKYSKSKHRLAQ